MNSLKKMSLRGCAVIREWNDDNGLNDSNHRMLAQLSAATLTNMSNALLNEHDKAKAIKMAIVSAFQIGRSSS